MKLPFTLMPGQPVEIEPGVYRSLPPVPKYSQTPATPMLTFHIPLLTTEQIERYGLQRYVADRQEVNET